jgi:phosphatidylglycerophosphatase C
MTRSPSPHATVVAAFDVDGTLTVRDCVVPFLRQTAGLPRLVFSLLSRPMPFASALVGRDRDGLKALAARSLKGRSIAEINDLGATFANQIARSWLRRDTPARLRWHLDQGHEVVLVSASLRPYLEPLAAHLGASTVLCCELEVDGTKLTGRLDGANCRGPEKERRLRQWLGDRNVELWAYGDSAGDRELLAMADHGYLVKDVTLEPAP